MMPPFPNEQVSYLSAVNSAYYKAELDACKSVWQDGFYDNEVHDALVTQGGRYCLAADAIVYTRLPFTFTQAVVHLYTGGQRYGGYRAGKSWDVLRMVRVFSTLLVPGVLLVRISSLVRKRQPKHMRTFLAASPILYVLLTAWGIGELMGTLRGGR